MLTVPSIPEDTDRNGYFDLLAATVYVFDDSYVAPIAVPGSFEFRLTDSKGKELAKWAFDSERSAAAQRRFLVGPGYLFQLDLLAALGPGGDRLNATEGQLAVTLISPDGSRLSPRASTSVAVGSTR